MPAIVEMQFTTRGVENWTKASMQRAGRVAMQLVGKLHHRLFKPRKFGANAQQVYKLRRRSRKYNQRKRGRSVNGQGVRAIGEEKPFVWSGETRRLAMAGNKVNAKAPSAARHYVDVILNAPQLNRKPWVREEFETINKNEVAELRRQGIKRYERELFRRGTTKTRRSK